MLLALAHSRLHQHRRRVTGCGALQRPGFRMRLQGSAAENESTSACTSMFCLALERRFLGRLLYWRLAAVDPFLHELFFLSSSPIAHSSQAAIRRGKARKNKDLAPLVPVHADLNISCSSIIVRHAICRCMIACCQCGCSDRTLWRAQS